MTECAFGIYLNKTTDAGKFEENDSYCFLTNSVKQKSTGGRMIYKWNKQSVIKELIKLYLLEDGFIYNETDNDDCDDNTSVETEFY
jgi:hypothetical protein